MVWRANYLKIQEHNKANHSFSLGLNEFADLVKLQLVTYSKTNRKLILILILFFFTLQTQEEFAYFYLSTTRDVSEFPRSGIVHEAANQDTAGDSDSDDNHNDNDDDNDDDYDSGAKSYSSIDWRKKGYVTNV